ncbi:putative NAD(P)/FAD-binding protein YdhS [Sphingobium sp. B1D7B]|uniref:FAD/NAD(P)-binding protein n=1 Tax=Sphingobium sp. B1D7B TaxID=2940578 RepID=UPI00222599D6|nr:FAD/NAD(P)-binding protein [Sphingobium sp. B1D7B]MCW2404614.1 putative NAD(P)/FAD-binding protein YdhS [Sphingobium sp. B1D7B]
MLIANHIVIVGGGFSGTLLAVNLVRHGMAQVSLIERDPTRMGRGLAYGAAQQDHVLNVRAANMSAFPDEPNHFSTWLEARGLGGRQCFATRQTYGAYMRDLLQDAKQRFGDRLRLIMGNAVDLALREPDGAALLTLADGTLIEADTAVLTPGNLPPHDLPPLASFRAPTYVRDPWSCDIAEGLASQDTVLLIGSGLTAIDCALTLRARGFGGRVIALSRRGLMPHGHAETGHHPPLKTRPQATGSALIGLIRKRARHVGWRHAVDELRPFTQDIWRSADDKVRRRFLRHLRPFWDIHRHRLAPEVMARIHEMQANGSLLTLAGKISDAQAHDAGIAVQWRPRGQQDVERLIVRRAINCTGPLGDLTRTCNPLLRQLHDDGLIRPDALAIGIDVDREGRTINAQDQPNKRLFVAGPMTRGAHWEIVAVPDIRRQTWSLARYLTASHWVSGEGL